MGITKNVSRDTIEAIKHEAERIRKEYAYMGEIPLEGWVWEFVRRTPEYISMFKEMKEIAPVYKRNSMAFPHNYQVNPRVFELLEKITETGLYLCPTDPYEWSEEEDRFLVIPLRRDDSQMFCIALPHFNAKCSEIYERINLFLDINPVKFLPYKILFFFTKSFKNIVTSSGQDPFALKKTEESVTSSVQDPLILLSPTTPNDTLYFGVSKTAKKEIIMKHISAYLDAYLEPPKKRVRTDKWKHYLIAYDLKKHNNYDYPQIADVLSEAYPDGLDIEEATKERETQKIGKNIVSGGHFTERNCENFYKEALELIDGGYKKHLL